MKVVHNSPVCFPGLNNFWNVRKQNDGNMPATAHAAHGSSPCTFAQLRHTAHQDRSAPLSAADDEDLQPRVLPAGQASVPRPNAVGRHATYHNITAGLLLQSWRLRKNMPSSDSRGPVMLHRLAHDPKTKISALTRTTTVCSVALP